MKMNELGSPRGATRPTKRRGRGSGSGHGKTSCRGRKGAKKRSGRTTRPHFEGGQMPLARRIPKKGFKAPFRQTYQIVNIESLDRFEDNSIIGPDELKKARLISSATHPIKILGDGKLTKKLTVKAHKFSKSAKKKFEEATAKMEVIS
ncbi:MAG: 50S ribosomal protein L15 [Omnitrophica bacterium RIFCSPLOWO2_01_FULL_45_10]|nr:MAG: 50S ribosomal protein L15 [Omnitrophica bacterium RIFCSPLOWO2_01_FULL_45_10]